MGTADGGESRGSEGPRIPSRNGVQVQIKKYQSCDLLRVGSNDFEQKIEILYCQHDGYPHNNAETTNSDCHFTCSMCGLKSKYFFLFETIELF